MLSRERRVLGTLVGIRVALLRGENGLDVTAPVLFTIPSGVSSPFSKSDMNTQGRRRRKPGPIPTTKVRMPHDEGKQDSEG